ncbi:hypothetical protein EKE94_07480 [Mesobaculum littorinae]|uniref:Transcriptional regulator n=1 Tax=Mesobaculum littorinae TaxID=2486419 RepID=A0A438AJA3_9RHOB|nr:hypothetical protein [Mesobaculum littorinae]RVV98734.1 hypothetical protein EKE94_07480 [Mesobaculum littorinae]
MADRDNVRDRPASLDDDPLLTLTLHGSFALTARGGADVTPVSRKSQGLLALLATAPNAKRTRAWLQSVLWSESTPDRAAQSLRRELSGLRKHFAGLDLEGLIIGPVSVALNPATIAVANPTGGPDGQSELLEGIDLPDPAFEEWLRMERAALARQATPRQATALPAAQPGAQAPVKPPPPILGVPPTAPAGDAARARPVGPPSLTVQPFGQLSGIAGRNAEALTREVVAMARAFEGIFTIRAGQGARSVDRGGDMASDYVLAGYLSEGRVHAVLSDGKSELTLWSDRIAVPPGRLGPADIERVARRIVGGFYSELSDGDWTRLPLDHGVGISAWAAYQRGRVQEMQGNKTAFRRAIHNYQSAIDMAPDFLLPVTSLAFLLIDGIRLNWVRDEAAVEAQARRLHAAAVQTAPRDHFVRTLGAMLLCLSGRFRQAVHEMGEIIDTAPPSSELLGYHAALMGYSGDIENEIYTYYQALGLTRHPPNWLRTNLAVACLMRGDKTLDPVIDDALALDPGNPRAHLAKLLEAARQEDAGAVAHWKERLRRVQPDFTAETWRSRRFSQDPRDYERIRSELRRLGF